MPFQISRPVIIAIIAVMFLVGAFFYFTREKSSPSETVIATYGDLIQEVSVTGKVKPSQAIDLAFEKGGKINWIRADVGKTVARGEAIAGLLSSDIDAKLESAKAAQRKEEALLLELLTGTRPEEIRVQEVKIENARKALEDEKISAVDDIRDAYTKSDDAIRNKTDQFITNPRSTDPSVSFPIGDPQLRIDIELGRVNTEKLLVSWNTSLLQISPQGDLHQFLTDSRERLLSTKIFLENVARAVNALKASKDFSQATIDAYRTDIATARNNVNTAIANLSSALEDIRSAESAVSLAEEELVLKKAGAREEQIAAQKAKVEEARASVNNYKAELEKTILYSPFAGVITRRNAEIGEIIAANTPVLSLISADKLLIETNVPEADIAKISVGDLAQVTLDAYGDDVVFEARVISIEPAETVVEGVSTYKTKLQFTESDERIRSGMTANLDISTDRKINVIAISQRAVITKNGEKIVRVLKDGGIVEIPVTTGLRGSDGRVEILSGVSEGDEIVVFLEE